MGEGWPPHSITEVSGFKPQSALKRPRTETKPTSYGQVDVFGVCRNKEGEVNHKVLCAASGKRKKVADFIWEALQILYNEDELHIFLISKCSSDLRTYISDCYTYFSGR